MGKSPRDIALAMIESGKAKAGLSLGRLLTLAILAGAYISLGALGASVAQCTIENASLARLIGASVFPVGLMLVIAGGAELFTGNCLMVLPALNGDITLPRLLRNWGLAYLGNLAGALLIAWLASVSGVYALYGGALEELAVKTGETKAALPFFEALTRGVLCNLCVCGAVWMASGASDTPGKLLAAFFPVMLFVLCGFEHSIANMFYIPVSLLLGGGGGISGVLRNLVPVTLGNVLGGGGLAAAYYLSYVKAPKKGS